MATQLRPLHHGTAEVLLWQSRFRIAVALFAGGIEITLQRAGVLRGGAAELLAVLAAYLGITALIALHIRASGRARDWLVALTVLADLLFIFGMTLVVSPPAYYDRVLILSFFIVHLTESYFGAAFAWTALAAIVVGYLGIIGAGIRHGAHLTWADELLTAGAFALATSGFIAQYDSFRRRMTKIVALFERAEQGDLTEAYDTAADTHPDAITQVGRAYNRVRSHLESMVTTDPLTECLNRRGFDQYLAREAARSARAGSEVALLALDLDHFKNVNDSLGHLAGDEVLRDTGALLRQAVRTGDIVARTGGEEFSILLPDTGGPGAYQLAERICEIFRERPFAVKGKEVRVTVSVGVVAAVPAREQNIVEQLKARADDALYSAKRSGRDRVRTWAPEMASRRSMEMPAARPDDFGR